jgi:Tol biopolymer transport system component
MLIKKQANAFLCSLIVVLFQLVQQLSAGTNPEVKAVRLSELHPTLSKSYSNTQKTSEAFLENAAPNLDKTAYYNRREGILYFTDPAGKTIQQFDLESLGLKNPGHNKWSPDGSMMLSSIFKEAGGGASLYLLNIDGTIKEVVPAKDYRVQILQPCWSFDGKMYAYLKSEVGSGHEIWAKTIASGEEILIERVPAFGGSCGNPVWFNQHYKTVVSQRLEV